MRNMDENPIKLGSGETLSHEQFVDRWIEVYGGDDLREAVSILLAVNRSLTDKLQAITGRPAHELFDNH